MLWILPCMGSYVYAAATTRIVSYTDSSCSEINPDENIYYDYGDVSYDSCAAFKAVLSSECNDVPGENCDSLPDFPFCWDTSNTWIAEYYMSTTEFTCEDASDPPTLSPTNATCYDNIPNGLEEGTDCGGNCPNPCPATCNTLLDCGTSHYHKADLFDIECLTDECNLDDDVETCCIAKALCSTMTVPCGINQVTIDEADSTYCAEDDCNVNDRDVCCTAAGTCAGFTLCDSETQYLKDSPENLYCDSAECDTTDITKCCKNKQACSDYTCNYGAGLVNFANANSIYCQYDDCGDDSSASTTCCENRAMCSDYTCDGIYIDRADKDTLWCDNAVCDSQDWAFCCLTRELCKEDLRTYECSADAQYPLSPDARTLYCETDQCQSPGDDAFCCIATPSPTATDSPTVAPPTPEPVATPSPTATDSPTLAPPTPEPVDTPTPEPVGTPVDTPTPEPVGTPAETPEPTPVDTPEPTGIPTKYPTRARPAEITPIPTMAQVPGEVYKTRVTLTFSESVTPEALEDVADFMCIYGLLLPADRCTYVLQSEVTRRRVDSYAYEFEATTYSLAEANEVESKASEEDTFIHDVNVGLQIEDQSLTVSDVEYETSVQGNTTGSGDSGLSIGIIVVIVIAAVIFIAVVSAAVYRVSSTKGKTTKGPLIEM